MRRLTVLVVSAMFAVGMAGIAVAGSLDSPGLPPAGSGMYTIDQVYNYLSAGTAPTAWSYFQGPATGPTVSTMKTMKQIVEAVQTPFAQCDATAANVESGKKFFSTQSGSWGVQTGTAYIPPTPTWYVQYGPAGAGLIVKIGSSPGMYVARWTDNAGTDFGATKNQTAAMSWASGLSWLGKASGWRLPSMYSEMASVCANKSSLGAYVASDTWGDYTTQGGCPSSGCAGRFSDCQVNCGYPCSYSTYVRAVRTAE
ncbi:MAG: hypothetical protein NTZ78_09630 [Candidatus Aureabacteria bacterium]|nr:hypothetical protein [Candidatus Auribacterota bacterium]